MLAPPPLCKQEFDLRPKILDLTVERQQDGSYVSLELKTARASRRDGHRRRPFTDIRY
jgi:hypothetical protein